MSFTDTLKRSLGFEETESDGNDSNDLNITEILRDLGDNIMENLKNTTIE